MENTQTVQPKPEENNAKIPEPNTETNSAPKEDKNKENIPTVNEVPKLNESQIVPTEEKKEEPKQENQIPISNPPPEQSTQIVPKQDTNINNNIQTEKLPVEEPPKTNPKEQIKQNDEIQEIEEIKPEPKKEDSNKMKFTHPMNNYCSPESIKEIETCPPEKLFPVISKRLNSISSKLSEILKNHERYTLICLYYKISSNFMQNANFGRNPKIIFQQKDPGSRLKISDFDFQEVLVNILNCQITTDELYLILRSLKQKTETLYSYDEFLKNVYNIQASENEFKSNFC